MEDKLREPPDGKEVRCVACGTISSQPLGADSSATWSCPRCGHGRSLAVSIPLDPRPLRKVQVKPPRFH